MSCGPPTCPAKARAIVGGAMILATLAAAVIVEAPSASAAGPAFVQSASGTGSNATTGSSVPITVTLAECLHHRRHAGGVRDCRPAGGRRRRRGRHAAGLDAALRARALGVRVAAYHVWFALSGCSGVSAATFTITEPGNPDGTTGSVVLSEYSTGCRRRSCSSTAPTPVEAEAPRAGPSPSGRVGPRGCRGADRALDLFPLHGDLHPPRGGPPSGSTTAGSLPVSAWWQTGLGTDAVGLVLLWSPSSAAWELSMVILARGPLRWSAQPPSKRPRGPSPRRRGS